MAVLLFTVRFFRVVFGFFIWQRCLLAKNVSRLRQSNSNVSVLFLRLVLLTSVIPSLLPILLYFSVQQSNFVDIARFRNRRIGNAEDR